jgi:hypothetical protein
MFLGVPESDDVRLFKISRDVILVDT